MGKETAKINERRSTSHWRDSQGQRAIDSGRRPSKNGRQMPLAALRPGHPPRPPDQYFARTTWSTTGGPLSNPGCTPPPASHRCKWREG